MLLKSALWAMSDDMIQRLAETVEHVRNELVPEGSSPDHYNEYLRILFHEFAKRKGTIRLADDGTFESHPEVEAAIREWRKEAGE
jgi:hypothetical protein